MEEDPKCMTHASAPPETFQLQLGEKKQKSPPFVFSTRMLILICIFLKIIPRHPNRRSLCAFFSKNREKSLFFRRSLSAFWPATFSKVVIKPPSIIGVSNLKNGHFLRFFRTALAICVVHIGIPLVVLTTFFGPRS